MMMSLSDTQLDDRVAAKSTGPAPPMPQAAAPHQDQPLLGVAERTALHGNPWFAALPMIVRHDILRHCSVRRFAHDAQIHADDDSCVRLDAVASGAVRVSIRQPGTLAVEYLPAGNWLVDPAMFGGRERLHLVATHGRATIVSVRAELLSSLMRRHRCLHTALAQLNHQRLEKQFDILQELATLPLPVRLARCIDRLSRRFGKPDKAGVRIALPLKQDALADLVRASRQRLNYQLKRLEAQGIVRVQRELVVTNPGALENWGG